MNSVLGRSAPVGSTNTATILPLLFLSGVFISIGDDAPEWITWEPRT